MAKPIPRKRGAHSIECASLQPKPATCNCAPNPLDSDDFERMHIPTALWGATLKGVTESVQTSVQKFSERIKEVKLKGISLYISGLKGTGKSGAATVILKEARAWGFTAYSVSVTELRESIRTHSMFDAEFSIMDRCRLVDFLLLDDLRAEDAVEKLFSITDIRNLIVNRYDRGLPTLVTSPFKPMDWNKDAPGIQDAIEKCCATLVVTGPDRHKAAQSAKNEFLK